MATTNTYRDFSVAATEAYPLISNIEFLLEPQIVKELFNVNPLESDVGDFMKMGMMEEVFGEEIIHREKRKIIDAPYLNSDTVITNVYGTASVGNGDPAAFSGYQYVQLSPLSHSPTAGDLTNTKSYPRVGMIIEFTGKYFWRIQGKRESVANAHRLYITPLSASYPALSATISLVGSTYGGDQITLPTANFEEATWGMQDGSVPVFTTYRSYLSTFGNVYNVTDKQEMNKTYEIYDPQTGQTIKFWHEIGLRDTEDVFLTMEAMGLFVVPAADAAAVVYDPISASNKTLTTSNGYIPVLDANAPHQQYGDNITFTLYKQLARLRNRLNQKRDCMMWYGQEFGYLASDTITALGNNGSIVYDHKAVDLGIDSITIPGATFNMKELRILNNPQLTNIPGRPYPYYFIIAPMDKTQDAKTGIPMDAFTIMYKRQVGGGSRGHYKIWQTGGNAPVPTNTQRLRTISLGSEKGVRVVGSQKHILGVYDLF